MLTRAALLPLILVAGFDLPVAPPPQKFDQPKHLQGSEPSRGGPNAPQEKPTPKPEPTEDPSDVPPPTFFGEELTDVKSMVFVIDQSGSMSAGVSTFVNEKGETVANGSRFDLAVSEVNKTLLGLDPTHSYEVELFVCGVAWAHQRKLLPATPGHVSADVRWLKGQFPYGGTGTGPAVAMALGLEPDAVILLTDGAPGCTSFGVDFSYHERLILSANRKPTPIHVWGIGLTSNTRQWCQRIAATSGGMFREVN